MPDWAAPVARLTRCLTCWPTIWPTLKLFSHDNNISRLRQIVAQYHTMGGRLMFGTGFLRVYSIDEEYRQLGLAGLSFREVLAMLTTAPAGEFRVAAHAGRIRVGNDADLTVLVADPSAGKMEDFARVLYAIRAGRVTFARDRR
jgi:imidazolonepropionase-like amidohydrolase